MVMSCALVLFAADEAITLWGQPQGYWSGNQNSVLEANPFGNWALRQHLAVFVTEAFLYAGCFSLLILFLPHSPALVASVAVCLAHAYGVASWIWFLWSFWLLPPFFLASAVIIVWGWKKGTDETKR